MYIYQHRNGPVIGLFQMKDGNTVLYSTDPMLFIDCTHPMLSIDCISNLCIL